MRALGLTPFLFPRANTRQESRFTSPLNRKEQREIGMAVSSVSGAPNMLSREIESRAADRFAARQMGIMQEIIQGRNAAERAFVDSHPDTRQAFESMISSLFAAGSSHANQAARIAATVQEMRAAARAYQETMGVSAVTYK